MDLEQGAVDDRLEAALQTRLLRVLPRTHGGAVEVETLHCNRIAARAQTRSRDVVGGTTAITSRIRLPEEAGHFETAIAGSAAQTLPLQTLEETQKVRPKITKDGVRDLWCNSQFSSRRVARFLSQTCDDAHPLFAAPRDLFACDCTRPVVIPTTTGWGFTTSSLAQWLRTQRRLDVADRKKFEICDCQV